MLSDSELNDFQVHCFAVPLQPEELAGVKAVVSQKMPEVRGTSRPFSLVPPAYALYDHPKGAGMIGAANPVEGGAFLKGSRVQHGWLLLDVTSVPAGCRASAGVA